TLVSSYYVSFDPGASRDIVGDITFPGDILGIATTVENLTDTDAELGNPTAIYLNPGLRGLEVGDAATFSGDALSVAFAASSPGDYVRVLVGVADTDGDGVADEEDNCTLEPNLDQTDADADGYGNACDADLNNDCIVNVVDLGILRSVFFTDDAVADLNSDGVVNVVDLGILRAQFFAAPGPSALSTACD
ncbi:MAG: thrombospondin type 3 repeat-containing protein, partial [Gammaproteobacteria bacterium]